MIGLMLISFVLLLAVGAPIVVAMGLPAVVYFLYNDITLSIVSYSFYQSLYSFNMLAIPMFILMGNLVTEFGETEKAFRFARAISKGKRGYSSKIAVILNLIFAGMSGAAISAVVGLGPMMVDEMDNEGYDRGYAAAMTIAASTVGPVFPPSIPLVIYATLAGISSTKSLLSGMIPGVVLSLCLLIWVIFTHKKYFVREARALPEENKSTKQLFLDALPIMLAPVLILITMLLGVFSPGETGAMAAFYMIVIGIFHRGFTFKGFYRCIIETVKSCSSILILMVAGGLFTKALMLEGLPEKIMSLMGGFVNSPIAVLLIINFVLIIMGMFMESNSALILAAPIVLPITNALGFDPLHIGVMMVLNLMIGLSTPPFGLCIYAVAKVAKVPSEKVIKNVVPLYIPLGVALMLVTFIPMLSTWLPEFVFTYLI
ncbi:TRAP dicarboxylate transporter [Peptoniphilus sp. ING2-D1G]|nr:TRAP dicarboxylate transporter [Peptoniphilus sp. ING2-D1G]